MDISTLLIFLAQQDPNATSAGLLVSLVGLVGFAFVHVLPKVPVPTVPGKWMTVYQLLEKIAGAWGNQAGTAVAPVASAINSTGVTK